MPRTIAQSYIERLPIGARTRVQCCGPDKSLSLHRTGSAMQFKCFRCGEGGSIPVQRSLKELLQETQEVNAWRSKSVQLPDDCNQDLPGHALVWLGKAGVSERLWNPFIWYSPKLNRVCLQLMWNSEVDAVCTRDTSVPRPNPKYIVKYKYGFTSPIWQHSVQCLPSPRTHLVVVEDALSAVRVSDATTSACMCILGTHAGDSILQRLITIQPSTVTLWLDGDRGGHTGSVKLSKLVPMLGVPVRQVRTKKDPKMYSNEEIRRYLC